MIQERAAGSKDKAKGRTGLLCVAVSPDATVSDPQAEALAAAKQAEADADVIEIRLDSMHKPEIALFVRELSKPLLFTNRPAWEGGSYSGEESARINLLMEAIDAGAAYVDIEMKTAGDLRQQVIGKAKEQQAQVIISWHNFTETPSGRELEAIFHEQHGSGAQIGKIVTMAQNYGDVLRVLDLQLLAAEKGFPLIAFCMGRAGVISRLATVELGGYMTYAVADSGQATAAGQLKASVLHSMLQSINKAE